MAWQGYADDDWVKEFQDQTGADVNVVFIGTDDEIWAKIKGSEGKDFDVFAVNTAQLQRYIDAGLTTPHDLAKLPNQKEVLPRFRDLTQGQGRDARRQGLRHSVRLRFDRPHLRQGQGEARPPTSLRRLLGSEIQGQDPGLRQWRAQFLVHRADDGHRGSVPSDAPSRWRRSRTSSSTLKHNVLSFYTTARRGAAALQEQRRGADLGQLRPAAGQGDEGCRRQHRLCQPQGGRACLARHLGA